MQFPGFHEHPSVKAALQSLGQPLLLSAANFDPNDPSTWPIVNDFIPDGAPREEIANPNWLEHIKYFFTVRDSKCMKHRFDLLNYNDIKRNAYQIYGVTVTGNVMPDLTDSTRKVLPRWADVMKKNFQTWLLNGCPYSGDSVQLPIPKPPKPLPSNPGTRKNIASLCETEVEDLKRAFRGMMAKPIDDPYSYFNLAAYHGLPEPYYCWHHFSGFLTWHRAYSAKFEEAMQKIVPGIRLPYWNIAGGDPPLILWEEPFDKYTYPIDMKNVFVGRDDKNNPIYIKRGPSATDSPDGLSSKTTVRVDRETMIKGTSIGKRIVTLERIQTLTANAMKNANTFEDFAQWGGDIGNAVEKAHDSSHLLCGGNYGDMTFPDLTAFDPIFWFTHAEYDRLFWIWQTHHDATTIEGIRRTMVASGKFANVGKTMADVTLTDWVVPWVDYQDKEKTVPLSGFTLGSMIDIGNLQTLHYDPNTKKSSSTTFTSYEYDNEDWLPHKNMIVGSTHPFLSDPIIGLATGPARKVLNKGPDEDEDDQVYALFKLSPIPHHQIIGPFSATLSATHRKTSEPHTIETVDVFNRAMSTCQRCKSNPIEITFGVHPFSTELKYHIGFTTIHGLELEVAGLGFPKLEVSIVN